ncbi:hypothetical protein, partial [Acidaminococcus fermentans]|uniref:hypothetical protein n=1 Tax=Acidaminococcus fermentans TaxID=905 RepID=UPI00241EA83D
TIFSFQGSNLVAHRRLDYNITGVNFCQLCFLKKLEGIGKGSFANPFLRPLTVDNWPLTI